MPISALLNAFEQAFETNSTNAMHGTPNSAPPDLSCYGITSSLCSCSTVSDIRPETSAFA